MTYFVQEQEARRILDEVRWGRVNTYDIFPEGDYQEIGMQSPQELLQKYAIRYCEYLGESERILKIRQSCFAAMKQVENPSTFPMMGSLSSYVLGSNQCDELSVATWLKAYAEGKSPIRVLLADPNNPKTSNHGFVICGVSPRIFEDLHQKMAEKRLKIDELMSFLLSKECIVMDPYLNAVFPVKGFKDSVLERYCQKTGITDLMGIQALPNHSVEKARDIQSQLMSQAKRIADMAQMILDNPSKEKKALNF